MSEPETTKKKFKQEALAFGPLAVLAVLVIAVTVLGVKLHHRNALVAATQEQLTESKADDAKTQTQLAQATTHATDLQSQLDKAKAQAADLQPQVDLAKAAAAQLQSQLDQSRAQTADLQALLDKSKAQAADLETQLDQANSGSRQLLTQLDQAKIQYMDTNSKLQTAEHDLAQLQPLLLKARHMPVTTSLERANGGQSFTLHISSVSLQPVSVNIAVTGNEKARSQTNVIGAGATLDVKKLAAGDNVVIASEGYDSVNVIPQ